jgi:hypothetical protein
VLCGAVLTSFVVFWFVKSNDIRQNFAKLLLKQNRRGSNYRIIISFSFMYFGFTVTKGDIVA